MTIKIMSIKFHFRADFHANVSDEHIHGPHSSPEDLAFSDQCSWKTLPAPAVLDCCQECHKYAVHLFCHLPLLHLTSV